MTQTYSVEHFGRGGEPLVIIDDFASNPTALFDAACASEFGFPGKHYPGIRAQADPGYLSARMDLLKDVLINIFDLPQGAGLVECAFSLVTTPRHELTPIQRIPHFDTTDQKRLALLHYLCGPGGGGTAFYRHRSTGLETISTDRHGEYTAALQSEASHLPTQDYVDGSTGLFEETGRVEAHWNRMVIYRGYRLHSGVIPANLSLSPDPRQGRLTGNTFLQGR